MTHLFIFAGELSGDLHGSLLAQALYKEFSGCRLSGVTGPLMRQSGVQEIFSTEAFQVMGFSDVIQALPRLIQLFYQIRAFILQEKPDAVILIDYPGFNLRLAKSLRQKGYQGKIVQFIAPTIWAHGKRRLKTLETYFDLVLTIYPFERALFEKSPVQTQYIGNPLLTSLKNHIYQENWKEKRPFLSKRPLIALFPGSREGEIRKHLSPQLQLAKQIKKTHPLNCFAVSCAQESFKSQILNEIAQSGLKIDQDIFITDSSERYDLMAQADTAVAKSGTVTLELAMHETPTVVHYEVSSLNYLFAKYLLKLHLPNYCIVNILAGKTLFPEFVGKKIAIDDLVEAFAAIHSDVKRREELKENCRLIKEQLSLGDPSEKAAKCIHKLLSSSVSY